MDLDAAITANAEAVENFFRKTLPEAKGPEARLAEAMRYTVLGGGKHLRPFLTASTAALFDVPYERVLRVGAAVECAHNYALIHDDLPALANRSKRRGKPSNHENFDEATALLAGDALLSLAFQIIADEKTHSDTRVISKLVNGLAASVGHLGTVGGQMLYTLSDEGERGLGAITRLQQMKTGALIAFSCEAGGILGHARPGVLQALHAYAHDLGLAYQIVNDYRDLTKMAKESKISLKKQATRGKPTFISMLGPERAVSQAEILANQAVQHLDSFDERAEPLREMASYVLNRASK